MATNIAIATEQKLIRCGIKSMIGNMHGGQLNSGVNNSHFNIVGDISTPSELINLLARNSIDLLLLGYSLNTQHDNGGGNPLTSMDGYALTKWLISKYPQLKIVIISPYKHTSLIRMMLELGVAGYISMDVSEKTLERVITAVLNNEVYVERHLMKTLFNNQEQDAADITAKESEVLRLLCKGLSLTHIAIRMNLSIKTVSAHKLRAMSKLGVNSDCQLYCLLTKTRLFDIAF
ncbi:Capsular synthesis regulator component B [Serratia ficaria]|uniref:response regulator transcription factor n=1 Tax=Serratia ficaria TaxID=61651 RepID=UPI00217BF459|nr:response regulator transcription factor [Serratia ficaria]CAI1710447.1 Capsular synthesis regulator component B [Serratia ficaria]